tara:strand:+ start:644 stop:913 length:270 start_codon:yes stop_codon:yes gene_type:complete
MEIKNKTMNYKITNLSTKVVQFMTEKEMNTFKCMQSKSLTIYNYENITEGKIKFYDNILFTLGAIIVFYLLLFAMCYTFSSLDKLIFSL